MTRCWPATLRKYLAVLRLETQYSMRYRLNSLFYLSALVVPVVIQYFLWTTVYRSRAQVGDYSLSAMLTYYVVAVFLSQMRIVAWWDISESIKNGTVVHYLVRPWNHFWLYFTRSLAWTFPILLLLLPGYLILVFVLRHRLLPPASAGALAALILIWLAGGLFVYTLEYMTNLLAFWTERTRGFLWLLSFITDFLSGALVPLNLLPGHRWLVLQPLAALGYLPARVYLGQVSPAEFWKTLGILGLWLLALVPLAHLQLRRGLRRYQPPGG